NTRPPRPTRSCRKNIGPPSSHLIAQAITNHSGDEIRRPAAASAQSKSRFITLCSCRSGDREDPPKERVVGVHRLSAIEPYGRLARPVAHHARRGWIVVEGRDRRGELVR